MTFGHAAMDAPRVCTFRSKKRAVQAWTAVLSTFGVTLHFPSFILLPPQHPRPFRKSSSIGAP